MLPAGVRWLQDSVTTFHPDLNMLTTSSGDTLTYDWLVIATGLVLRSAMEHDNVVRLS